MQLSTISPAPRRCASSTQSRVSRAVSRAARRIAGELLHAIARRDGLAVDADDDALRAEALAQGVDQLRISKGRGN